MMHAKTGRKLHRTESHRKALFRNMVTSLLEHERIETTDAKAKELRKVADRMITWGKRGDLHARRLSRRVITTNKVVQKLFSDLAPRFKDREGGYTRIIKVGRRKGDNAPVSIIELTVQREVKAPANGKKAAKKKGAQPKTPEKSKKK
jgi:large subunit ribosomal protein L17